MYEISINDQVVKFNFEKNNVLSISDIDEDLFMTKYDVVKKAEDDLAGSGAIIATNANIILQKAGNVVMVMEAETRNLICFLSQLHSLKTSEIV